MRRQIFITHFSRIIVPVTIPVLVFSILALVIYNDRMIADIDARTRDSLKFSKDTIDIAFSDLGFTKTLIDSNPQLNLTLFGILRDREATYESTRELKSLYPYLNATSNSKPYIHSVYIAMGDDGLFLVDGNRQRISDYYDTQWYADYRARSRSDKFWTETRRIRNNGFSMDERTIISTFERIIHDGILVTNIKQDYFDSMLDSITIYPGQAIIVLNENGDPIFGNKNAAPIRAGLLGEFLTTHPGKEESSASFGKHLVTRLPSSRYGFTFISFIPNDVVYRSPYLYMKTSVIAAILSLLVSIALAYYLTRKNYRQIQAIMRTFEIAKRGDPLPTPSKKENDPYAVILDNVINAFIEQNYTKLQLSERKYRLIAAQLSALQYQLNPHFLFNTLQSINFEIMDISGGFTAANSMIDHLSDILRYSLYAPLETGSVKEEIEITKRYVELQKYRFDGAFDASFEVEDGVLQLRTIRLILLPLVENALYHAFGQEEASRLHIVISARVRDGLLEFTVADDGCGMDAENLSTITAVLESEADGDSSRHIGLKNTDRRLKLSYGDVAALHLQSVPGRGTQVSFSIPTTQGEAPRS